MTAKRLKTCDKGHEFYKSSDCPTCPVCAAADKPESGFLALLSAPARSALEHAGISTLAELSCRSEREILQLHGVGPKSLPILRQALHETGLAFTEPVKSIYTVAITGTAYPHPRPLSPSRRGELVPSPWGEG